MSIILLSIFPENVMAALVALIAGQSLGILMSLVFLRWKYRIAPVRPSMRRLWEKLSYGMRYYVGKISNPISFDVGTIILAMFAAKEDIGFFAVAARQRRRCLAWPLAQC